MIKPTIQNIVTTADLQQTVDVTKFVKFPWGIYNSEIYSGRCGYIKSPKFNGKITIFKTGKMISLGAKTIDDSYNQLQFAKVYLFQNALIDDVKLDPRVQNIVATLDLHREFNLENLYLKFHGAIYEPEQFAGLILKFLRSVTYLIFSNGKIVITGAKSEKELIEASFEIQKKLEIFQTNN